MKSVADLGLMVYGIRQRSGLSQRELASRLGVSQRYLSELETGKPKVLNEQFSRRHGKTRHRTDVPGRRRPWLKRKMSTFTAPSSATWSATARPQ